VIVAGDLLWYPVEHDRRVHTAPGALVVFGRPKGHRGSYAQFIEGGVAPQLVFEVLSPKNSGPAMARKRAFYGQYGVGEYYEYDPQRGRLRRGARLAPIAEMQGWVSPRLGSGLRLRKASCCCTGRMAGRSSPTLSWRRNASRDTNAPSAWLPACARSESIQTRRDGSPLGRHGAAFLPALLDVLLSAR